MDMFEIMLEFLQLCPQLADMDAHADYSEGGESWTLYDAGEEVESVYWDGGRRKKHNYSLAIQLPCSDDVERIAAVNLVQKVRDWLQEQSDLQLLPDLMEGCTAEKLDCLSGQMGVLHEDGISASYHLQLVLIYEERGVELGA